MQNALIYHIAIAYRWGCINDQEWYFLGISMDPAPLKILCDEYQNDRGGKYGCAIHKLEGITRCDLFELVYYTPSLYGEKKPYMSGRVETTKDIGQAVLSAIDSGKVNLPNPDPTKTAMVLTKVDVPDWLRSEAKRKTEWYDHMYPLDKEEEEEDGEPDNPDA